MKLSLFAFVSAALMAVTAAAAVPKVFEGLLEEGVPMRGEVGHVLPPPEYDAFAAKIQAAASKDLKWFADFSAKSPPGEPLPYDEKLGLTPEEHAEYLKLWAKREFKVLEPVILMLRKGAGEKWIITATGPAGVLSTMRYSPKDNTFSSPNGQLVPGTDVDAGPDTVYGEWKGKRWELDKEDTLGKTKEVLAFGKLAKTGHGLILYRFAEVTSEGTPVVERRIVVRFVPGKAGEAKPANGAPGATGQTPAPKPAPTPAKPKSKR
jgi:hypothetical protein